MLFKRSSAEMREQHEFDKAVIRLLKKIALARARSNVITNNVKQES